MGTAQTFAGISRLVAPVLSTAMFEHISQSTPFFFAAGIVCIGSLLAGRLPSATPAPQPQKDPVLN